MDWQSAVEEHFKALGFGGDWIWMNRRVLFFLAWKGNEIQVYQVEREWCPRPSDPVEVKDAFIELLGYLRRLSKWEKNFRGRDIAFKWMSFRELSEVERGVLREAGVEPFLFKAEDGGSAD